MRLKFKSGRVSPLLRTSWGRRLTWNKSPSPLYGWRGSMIRGPLTLTVLSKPSLDFFFFISATLASHDSSAHCVSTSGPLRMNVHHPENLFHFTQSLCRSHFLSGGSSLITLAKIGTPPPTPITFWSLPPMFFMALTTT